LWDAWRVSRCVCECTCCSYPASLLATIGSFLCGLDACKHTLLLPCISPSHNWIIARWLGCVQAHAAVTLHLSLPQLARFSVAWLHASTHCSYPASLLATIGPFLFGLAACKHTLLLPCISPSHNWIIARWLKCVQAHTAVTLHLS